jgi:hypothetical protein
MGNDGWNVGGVCPFVIRGIDVTGTTRRLTSLSRYLHRLIPLFILLVVLSSTSRAQPGYGRGTGDAMAYNSTNGTYSIMRAGGLNRSFNSMAVLLQQQVFLAAFAADYERVMKAQRAKVAHELKVREARGKKIIRQGQATTKFKIEDDTEIQKLIARTLGPTIERNGAVPHNLQAYKALAQQVGLSLDDFTDTVAACAILNYEMYHGKTVAKEQFGKVLADMRSRVRPRLLVDGTFQGLSDKEKLGLHEFLIVVSLAAVADYRTFQQNGTQKTVKALRDMNKRMVTGLVGVPPERIRITPTGMVIQ